MAIDEHMPPWLFSKHHCLTFEKEGVEDDRLFEHTCREMKTIPDNRSSYKKLVSLVREDKPTFELSMRTSHEGKAIDSTNTMN
jgi:hypothetical protein